MRGASAVVLSALAATVPSGAVSYGQEAGGAGRAAPQRVYVVVYQTSGVLEPDRRELEDAVVTGLRGAGVSSVLSPNRQVAAPEGPTPAELLATADEDFAAGTELVSKFELDAATERLERAAGTYSEQLPALVLRDGSVQRMADVYRQLAVVHFLNGNDEPARAALGRCFVLTPSLDFAPDLFAPQMENFVVEARLLQDEVGTGEIEVIVRGGEATVMVNGVDRGTAPVTLQGLPAGPTIVHAIPDSGAAPVRGDLVIEGGASHTLALEVSPLQVAIPEQLAAVRSDVGAPRASTELKSAGAATAAGALVAVVPSVVGDELVLEAYLYDLSTGRLAGTATARAPVDDPVQQASALGGALWGAAKWGVVAQPRVPRAAGPPLWDHKYFWPAVGAAAGVVLTGVVVGVVASRGGVSDRTKVVVFGLGTTF